MDCEVAEQLSCGCWQSSEDDGRVPRVQLEGSPWGVQLKGSAGGRSLAGGLSLGLQRSSSGSLGVPVAVLVSAKAVPLPP